MSDIDSRMGIASMSIHIDPDKDNCRIAEVKIKQYVPTHVSAHDIKQLAEDHDIDFMKLRRVFRDAFNMHTDKFNLFFEPEENFTLHIYEGEQKECVYYYYSPAEE